MPGARFKENGYDVVKNMRLQGKKGKQENSDPIHSADAHKLYCIWLPATRKYVTWDSQGNHHYTAAFDQILKDNPQDLRLQSGYRLLQHKGVWRIYFMFTCKSDVRSFIANSGVTFFRLTEKVPGIRGRWEAKDLDNIFRLESYPAFLSRKAIPDENDVVEFLNEHMIPKAFPNRVFPISIIRIRRQRFSIEMEFSDDLLARDVEALRKVEIENHKFSVHGLYGNRFYSCAFCGSKNHLPRECPLASRKYLTMHFDYLLSKKDLRTISKQTGGVDVLLGTPKSEPVRPWMDHCTIVFNSEKMLVKNKEKLSNYSYRAKPTNVDLWTKPQMINCCSLCGLNRSSDYCRCKSIVSVGPIISAEAHLSGKKADSGASTHWNPWASADHAEVVAFQEECQKSPPEDVKFEEPDLKAQKQSVGAAAFSAPTGASSVPGNKRASPRKQSNPKPFFQSLQDKGLKILDIPENVVKPAAKLLQRSQSGWRATGKSQYGEKILGNTDLFGGKMAISYDANKKLRYANNWNLKFEELAREASKIASSAANFKVDVNMFIANRYDSDDQTGGVHADIEPQCEPKVSVVIPIGPREFHFMNSKDPSSPGYQTTCVTVDTGQMILIPPELNAGPHQVFHSKGKGLAGGQHFTLVGKTFVGLQKSH